MGKERIDLGFGSDLDSFNPEEWAPPKLKTANDRPPKAETKKAATAAGFKSREASPESTGQGGLPRRRRTGRNMQFNLKARPETIEAFCRVADENGWGLGETLEYAVTLLEEAHRLGRRKGEK
jgi:hypothetical protein